MNSRTMGILAGWEHPALIDDSAKKVGVEHANVERRPIEVTQQLDQGGPSLEVMSL
ncbi:MAG: hypothetical protein WA510_09265 [Acidobacteriaceae bacterium]